MGAYKLQVAFKDLNEAIDFYKTQIKKTEKNALATLTSMGTKGLVTSNPDGTVSIVWFFRSFGKYDKFVNAFLKYTVEENHFTPQARKTYVEMVNN